MTQVAEALVRGYAKAIPEASKLLSHFWVLLLLLAGPIVRIRYRKHQHQSKCSIYLFSMSILDLYGE